MTQFNYFAPTYLQNSIHVSVNDLVIKHLQVIQIFKDTQKCILKNQIPEDGFLGCIINLFIKTLIIDDYFDQKRYVHVAYEIVQEKNKTFLYSNLQGFRFKIRAEKILQGFSYEQKYNDSKIVSYLKLTVDDFTLTNDIEKEYKSAKTEIKTKFKLQVDIFNETLPYFQKHFDEKLPLNPLDEAMVKFEKLEKAFQLLITFLYKEYQDVNVTETMFNFMTPNKTVKVDVINYVEKIKNYPLTQLFPIDFKTDVIDRSE